MPIPPVTFRVYYEDTDAGGVMYHANYLKFAERARTEWLRSCGIEQIDLAKQEHILLLVTRATVHYKMPARLDDLLTVHTHIQKVGQASLHLEQKIAKKEQELATLDIVVACVGPNNKATRWPKKLHALFEQYSFF